MIIIYDISTHHKNSVTVNIVNDHTRGSVLISEDEESEPQRERCPKDSGDENCNLTQTVLQVAYNTSQPSNKQ